MLAICRPCQDQHRLVVIAHHYEVRPLGFASSSMSRSWAGLDVLVLVHDQVFHVSMFTVHFGIPYFLLMDRRCAPNDMNRYRSSIGVIILPRVRHGSCRVQFVGVEKLVLNDVDAPKEVGDTLAAVASPNCFSFKRVPSR